MKVAELYKNSSEILKNKGILTSNLDVRILLAFILGIKTNDLFFYFEKEISDEELNKFNSLLYRRIQREPIANIINKKSFWDFDFFVNETVLTPRNDSETIIESVMENFANFQEKLNILDLGTGSGCLILTLLKIYKNSFGIAVDISEEALNIAKKNAEMLNVKNVKFIKSNWNDLIEDKFDIIISNPPYIAKNEINNLEPEVNIYNPILSLCGGEDGLDFYKYLAENLQKNIKKSTKIFLEIGKGQHNDVENIFKKYGYKLKKSYKDLNKVERVLYFEV